MIRIKFLGAARTVSGSKFLVDTGKTRFLVDCGMFQGPKHLRLLNWAPPTVAPASIDAVLLTHTHIDHSGMLPVLVRDGYKGRILATPVTAELGEISLLDSAHLQEEDARFANKMSFSKHKPALPLFTTEDAERAIRRFQALPYDEVMTISEDTEVRFRDAGHILGSAIVETAVKHNGGGRPVRIVFSGDLGRYDTLILRDPSPVDEADYLIIESTYGSRLHPPEEPLEELAG
ncbi:MAG TPA: MBL fold metallo-hydrolase, partial [Acidobacteriota bacterium]|nr:MBL fold metallo-hydrolase [Acidobacteriota bacterium]